MCLYACRHAQLRLLAMASNSFPTQTFRQADPAFISLLNEVLPPPAPPHPPTLVTRSS
jgi:hypothetical protein